MAHLVHHLIMVVGFLLLVLLNSSCGESKRTVLDAKIINVFLSVFQTTQILVSH